MGKPAMLLVFLALAFLTVVLTPFAGQKFIPPSALFSDNQDSRIFWDLRVPQVCAAFVAGAALSLSGMAFQALFRNALATPFTLGVASGASLGAAISVRLGFTFAFLGVSATMLSAFLGSLGAILLVSGLTWTRRGLSTEKMLLAGVAVNFFFVSLILFIQYTSDFYDASRLMRWLMGNLAGTSFNKLVGVLPFVAAGAAVLVCLTHELNLISTGDEIAVSRGVAVRHVKRLLFVATSLMVGGVVAMCGPIGFVGMMAPHITRLLIGPDHRYLTPATILFGGAFLTLCDSVAQTVIAPAQIPVGVITALLGGPFFLLLLLRHSRAGDL